MPQHIFDKLDLPISGSGGTSSVSFVNNPKSVAAQFSALVGYTKGQLVYYDNALYRFTADHAAGAWNSGHVTAVTVAGELKAAQEEVADLKEDLSDKTVAINLANGKIKNVPFGRSGEAGELNVVYSDGKIKINGTTAASAVVLEADSDAIRSDSSAKIPYRAAITASLITDNAAARHPSIEGGKYRIVFNMLSGSVTKDGVTYTSNTEFGRVNVVQAFLLKADATTDSYAIAYTKVTTEIDLESTNLGLQILYCYKGCSFDNAVFELYIEKVAELTDKTLTLSGIPADAEIVGTQVSNLISDNYPIRTILQEASESTSAYYITADKGVYKPLASGNTDYKVNKYDVDGGSVYYISGSAYGRTCVYSFCDSDNKPMLWYNAERTQSSGIYEVITHKVIAPYGAKYVYVAYISTNQFGVCLKATTGWAGLKWAVIGDSITDSNNSRATKRYFDYISDAMGINVINLGKSGTGYKKPYNSSLPFYQRVDTIPLDADVITIFGSGNDCSLTLGEPTDTTDATICGCVNLIIDGIRNRILGAKLGIITPTPWVQYPTTSKGNKMDLYSDALVEICRLKSVPCLDLYHCSNMLPWDEAFRNAFYKHDDGNGVHPDEDGHKLFAPRIKAFLETLLM